MSSFPLTRTQYWNLFTDTLRGGPTGHGESLTDMENYLLRHAQMLGSGLYTWGVAEGLAVSATANQADVTVAPGAALDTAGRLIALAANGLAVTDPNVDPGQVINVPTVLVGAAGVTLATATFTGDHYVTMSWREVLDQGAAGNLSLMQHTPWLRLAPVAGFQDTGEQVVLARVSLDNNSQVTALTGDGRRLVGVPAQRVELRHPQTAGLQIDQAAGAELRARADGGAELALLPAGTVALAVAGSGKVGIGATAPSAKLEIDLGNSNDLALKLSSSGPGWGSGLQLANAHTYGMYSGSDGNWHFADALANADRLIIDPAGKVGIGAAAPAARLEIDQGNSNDLALKLTSSGPGWGSGLQLSNTAAGARTFGMYSGSDGNWHLADLSSNLDSLRIAPADDFGELHTRKRMVVHQGNSLSAGIWILQEGPTSAGGFVGMADNDRIGFWGNNGAGWGLLMNTNNRSVGIGGDLTVSGNLTFLNSAGGAVTLGGSAGPMNDLQPNNVKLTMASGGIGFLGTPTYEFAVGHDFSFFGQVGGQLVFHSSFIKRFSVNSAGNAFFAGGKSGYVMDYFVNRVGDSLEQGDVVVTSEQDATRYLGTNNNIPVPEVDLTDRAYDTRVCGVVAQLVTEADLPFVEPEPVPEEALEAMRTAAAGAASQAGSAGPAEAAGYEAGTEAEPYEHPWRSLAAATGSDLNRTPVAAGQLGHMATYGAFAHCKVDADIAPIRVGDLLTTSPTRGHAQKVEDPGRAAGAIIGKALGSLESGKGKIPVLITLG